MDVHRDFLVACIAATDNVGVTTYESKRFSTYASGIRDLCDWLASRSCRHVCMESTGKYWFHIHKALEQTCNVVVTHPKFVKAIKGKKTDKKDAQWIADLFKHDLVRGSFIPPDDIRQLRDLCRYWCKLTSYTTGEKNRFQNCLTVSGFKLDAVFSSVFGKSASAVIEQLLSNPGQDFDIGQFVDGRCRTAIEQIRLAVDGRFAPEQADKLRIIRSHMDFLSKLQDRLEAAILAVADKYPTHMDLLLTVPGVASRLTAARIIGEIGVNMSVFETSKHLTSWAGLTPQNAESAGKKKTTRIGKAGVHIKPLLVQIVIAACRSDKYPELKLKRAILKKRRGGKKATIAIARRLLTAIYHMFARGIEYQPYVAIDKPPKPRHLTSEQALKLVTKMGYTITEAETA
jgi:transposase